MRTRLFLRTAEFLWQEGHSAHADEPDARAATMGAIELYRSFAEGTLAMPVVAGEKPEHERFPGAVNTYSIEAMMQDSKALQSGTSHYLGTNFASAQDIRYQNESGSLTLCHTTSWGLSTRVIGGVIMTHGDDDGLRLPPAIAPMQIALVPMLRGDDKDSAILEYCEIVASRLNQATAFRLPLRAYVDKKQIPSSEKRWNWVRCGVPLILEIGQRDVAVGNVTFMRRDALRSGEKDASQTEPRDAFIARAPDLLAAIQSALYDEARERLTANVRRGLERFEQVADYFGVAAEDVESHSGFKGWVQAAWCKPTGAALNEINERLKKLKLTIRCAPFDQPRKRGKCIFTGKKAVEEIIIARAY
jgi:prolyl-tRNA synthetase